jgi:hypothetical protein
MLHPVRTLNESILFKQIILSVIAVIVLCGFTLGMLYYHNNGYERYPAHTDYRTDLAKYIIPDKAYKYWVFVHAGQVIYSHGKRGKIKIAPQNTGFFIGCLPIRCFSYIAYVDSGKVKYITSEKGFRTFIGKINNVEEAFLTVFSEGMYINNSHFGQGYKRTDDGYELLVEKLYPCPYKLETIWLKVNQKGIMKQEVRSVEKNGSCNMF